MKALRDLAQFADICRKVIDPEERAKCVGDWFKGLPANQQQLINDLAPIAHNVGKRILEKRVPRL